MHELYEVTAFRIVGPYTLDIWFDDGTSQRVDFEPILYGQLFGPLRNIDFFNQVKIDPEFHTLVWPNDADFDPETLRNWPDYRDEFIAMARRWAVATPIP